MILHTVNKSPFSDSALANCLQVASPDDFILLIEDGVYALLSELPSERNFFALKSDAETRGLISHVKANVQLVDFSEFVELSTQASAVQSWY